MFLRKRKPKSQRVSNAIRLTVYNSNTAGQGGDNQIILWAPDDEVYYLLELKTDAETRELLSAVQKARAHVK